MFIKNFLNPTISLNFKIFLEVSVNVTKYLLYIYVFPISYVISVNYFYIFRKFILPESMNYKTRVCTGTRGGSETSLNAVVKIP